MLLNFYQFSSLDYKYNHKFIPIELLTDYTSLIELGWFLKIDNTLHSGTSGKESKNKSNTLPSGTSGKESK